ncbi:MAG: T9SS type A sorting domain-containing protein, partial [Bacteroidales bacterium]|nr:T9SS type A sorting domain-containing protein [Bacteroidales bacterium]
IFPEDVHLSADGVLSGNVTHPYDNKPLHVKVIDNNDIVSRKTLSISSLFDNRIVVSGHSILAGDDNKIDAGEEVKLTVSVTNIDSAAVTNARIVASSADPFVSFTDNEEYFGYIGPGNTYTLNNAFRFNVSGNVPNEHPIHIDLDIQCDGFPSHTQITLIAYSVDISIENVIVLDGNNNTLNASETDTIRVFLKSTGGSVLHNIIASISTTEQGIEMIKSTDSIATLSPDQPIYVDFIVNTQASFIENRMYDFVFRLNAPNDFEFTKVISLFSGNVIEDFETANFSKFPWTFNEHPWMINSDFPYQGVFSARSGLITHNENSDMSLTINALVPGFVRFYKKTSCEYHASGTNWDYLAFYLNGVEKGRWDGQFDWSESFYPIAAGENTLKFSYKKDYSVNAGSDAVWVDNISFPVIGSANIFYDIAPDSIVLTMLRNQIQEVPLYIYNTAQSLLMYQMELKDPSMYNLHWLTAHYAQGSLNGFEMDDVSMVFDSHFLPPGIYHGNIILTFNNANIEYIPICLTVVSGQNITENQYNISFNIYPNPSTHLVNISSESSNKIQKVEVYSIQGKLIKSIDNQNSNLIQMDVRDLNSGIYLVKIESNNQFAVQRLLVGH